jgi:AcrR family transcriptional regulator
MHVVMASPGRGRWERHLSREERHSAQRRKILESLPPLIAERGNAFTVDDVVDAAGIGRNTFYVHFEDADAATAALLWEALDELNAALEAVRASARTPLARVRGVTAAWAHCAATNPALSLLAHAEAEGGGVNGALAAHLNEAVAAARRAGVLGREPDALHRALLIGAFDAAAVHAAAHPHGEAGVAEALVDLILRLLR